MSLKGEFGMLGIDHQHEDTEATSRILEREYSDYEQAAYVAGEPHLSAASQERPNLLQARGHCAIYLTNSSTGRISLAAS